MRDAARLESLSHLQDEHELEAAFSESRVRPVLLFKHSRHCGVSCEALDELRDHIARARGSTAYKMITVQTHRGVSDAAARRLGVRHETPQAILLRDGEVAWNASHFRITGDELDRVAASH